MSRKGYYSEYKIMQMLKKEYPNCDIMRNPIADFMIIDKGRIIKIIEVKSMHYDTKFYPTIREKRQLKKIKEFSIKHNIDSEIWLDRIVNGSGKEIEITPIHKATKINYQPHDGKKFYCPKCKIGVLYIIEDEISERGNHEIRCNNCDWIEPI